MAKHFKVYQFPLANCHIPSSRAPALASQPRQAARLPGGPPPVWRGPPPPLRPQVRVWPQPLAARPRPPRPPGLAQEDDGAPASGLSPNIRRSVDIYYSRKFSNVSDFLDSVSESVWDGGPDQQPGHQHDHHQGQGDPPPAQRGSEGRNFPCFVMFVARCFNLSKYLIIQT